MFIKLPAKYHDLNAAQKKMVREYYDTQQGGLCLFCKGKLTDEPPESVTNKKINWKLFPPGFLKYPVHLQHDHTTGLTEGAVHSYCNAVMWQYHGK